MSDRRAPDLSTGEGATSYRRGTSSGARASGSGGVGRQLGTNLMLALLIAGLVLAGWFIANQQQMIAAEQDKNAQAVQRLEYLEARLSATDSALSQEGEDTQQQLSVWETETRRLHEWNERNRDGIKKNETAINKVADTINGIVAANRDLNAAVGRHETAFAQQQTMIDQLASVELQIQQIVRSQRDLVDKVNAATQGVSSLRSSLVSRVDDNAEAIQSIDAYRVAVNSRLAEIERRLGGAGLPGGG